MPYLVSARWIEEESIILVTDTFCVLTSVIAQRDATQSILFIILQVHSTCFGCQPHLPGLSTLEVGAQKIWAVPDTVVTVLCTPDDGCGWDPKGVDWTCRIINRLLCGVSRWAIITWNLQRRCCQQVTSSVLYTTSWKHSLVLLRMDKIIARNMLSWFKLLIKLLLSHLVCYLCCCINDVQLHKHETVNISFTFKIFNFEKKKK